MKRFVILMFFLLPLFCCAHKPVPVFQANVDQGGKTAVFFRFRTAEESTGSCVDKLHSRLTGRFEMRLSSLDTEQQIPGEEVLYSLPAEVASSDWVVFLLNPGSYGLVFDVYRSSESKYEKFEFFLGVPATTSGVYGGSFIIDCIVRRGHEDKPTWSELKIADESAEATRIISASLGGTPHASSIVSPYGQPQQGSKETPTAVAVNFGKKVPLQTPAWKSRAIGNALGYGGEVKPHLRKDTDVNSPLKTAGEFLSVTGGAIIIPMAYLAYAPFGAAYGYVKGSLDERAYGGCMQELTQETARFDLTSEARRILGASLSEGTAMIFDTAHHQAAVTSMTGRIASIELRRLQLRECLGIMAFCIEIEAHARVWDGGERRYVFAETLVYRHPFALLEGGAHFEIEIEQASGCRPISSYCGDGGKKILREELVLGVENVMRKALRDFGLSPKAGQESLERDDKGNKPRDDRVIQ